MSEIEKTGPRCGRTFLVQKSHADRYALCSLKCPKAIMHWHRCERRLFQLT